MIAFELSLDIDRPLADVFAWWADPNNIPIWQSGVTCVDYDGGAPGRGSRYTVHRKALGMTQQMRTTLVEFEENVRVVENSRGGPATNTVTTTFEELSPGRTQMATTVQVDLGGVLGRFGDKLAGGKVKSQAAGDQQRLKQALEQL